MAEVRLQFSAASRGRETVQQSESPGQEATQTYNYTALDVVDLAVDAEEAVNLGGAVGNTIDLTNVPTARQKAVTVDLTGKRLLCLIVKANAANTAIITIKAAAANPYPIGTIELAPGESAIIGGLATTIRPAVAPTVKAIEFTGTGVESLEAVGYFGS